MRIALADLVDRQLFAAEVLLHQRVVVRDATAWSISVVARLLDRVLDTRAGTSTTVELLAERVFVEDVLLALDDVDVAGEELARPDRQLERNAFFDRRSRIILMQRSKSAPTRSILFAKMMRGTP